MINYLSRLKTCSDHLREAGCEVKDEDLAYSMLAGLPDSYDGIIMNFGNMTDDEFTSSKLRQVLLTEHERKTTRKEDSYKEVLQVNKHQNNSSTDSRRKCYRCGKIGHIATNCRGMKQTTTRNRDNQHYQRKVNKSDYFLAALNLTSNEDSWLLDSGAINHVCRNKDWFVNLREVSSDPIMTASGTTEAKGYGHIFLQTSIHNESIEIKLNNVLYVPNVRRNLLSVSKIEENGNRVTIRNKVARVFNPENRIIAEETNVNGLYIVKGKTLNSSKTAFNSERDHFQNNSLRTWHQRLCHIDSNAIEKMAREELVIGLEISSRDKGLCYDCCIAKSTKASHKNLGNIRSKQTLELIHTDICGQMPVKSTRGNRYFLSFVDDFSRRITVYFLKNKDEVLKHFDIYRATVERQTETVNTAAYIKNICYNTALKDKVPDGLWLERNPSVRHLKAFGCLAYSHIPRERRRKLDHRACRCTLVGYSTQTRGYRLWCPESQKVIETKHVRFDESKIGLEWTKIVEETEPERYNHVWLEPETNYDNGLENELPSNLDSVGVENALPQPSTSKNIVRNPYGRKVLKRQSNLPKPCIGEKQWNMSLECFRNEALSTLPPGKKPISIRWVYKVKTNKSGNVERFKARLVARGFSQKQGIDFQKTYAPVINLAVIRVLITLSLNMKWYNRHLEVDNAYLYGDLEEEIYMLLPEGVERKDNEVYKLLRPIYGLRQSGRNWNLTLDHALQEMGFTRLESCNCIYTYLDKAIIAVYVDDLALFGESEEILRNIEQKINERFRVKNLGAIRNFLGVQIDYPDEETVVLSQSTYVKSILQKFNMIECRPVSTPLDISFPISKGICPTDEEEKERMKAIPYRELIGSLLYLANCTSPDLMFSVTRLAQFTSNPGRRHWQAAKHVLRYLHGSINLSLIYRRTDSNDVCAYSDADWARDIDDRRSNSGTAITIGHSLVIWKTSKQKCVSLSTMEAEYLALSQTTKEAVCIATILKELKFLSNFAFPLIIHCDNRSAIDFFKNNVENNRSKHIDIRYHHVRERIISGEIKIVYIPTKENLADVFTKTLSKACQFQQYVGHIQAIQLQQYVGHIQACQLQQYVGHLQACQLQKYVGHLQACQLQQYVVHIQAYQLQKYVGHIQACQFQQYVGHIQPIQLQQYVGHIQAIQFQQYVGYIQARQLQQCLRHLQAIELQQYVGHLQACQLPQLVGHIQAIQLQQYVGHLQACQLPQLVGHIQACQLQQYVGHLQAYQLHEYVGHLKACQLHEYVGRYASAQDESRVCSRKTQAKTDGGSPSFPGNASKRWRSTVFFRIVTGDESWVHHSTQETKRQSMVWKKPEESAPKKRRYCEVLTKLKAAIKRKRPGLLSRKLLLVHDNARPHAARTTQTLLENFKWEFFTHPPYSPELASSDFHLFPALKLYLGGKHFANDDEVQAEVNYWLRRQDTAWYNSGIKKLL
ncbi:hypothetical protein LAZ67_1007460 [Cordylochernes scorpioides]|uniref:CCHC-type domain-containing protein n=1 Tax=Cordylochernes scorpioides TaxID=51811 RepID=A0ABY6K0R9_9ARAC|nr:hypothetical protein LAZ67_1007460 [Cordylochernes scorpioides]